MIMQELFEQGLASFQSLLNGLYGKVEHKEALYKIRSKAWDHFNELGLPTKRNDVFRYVPLRQLYSKSYVAANKSALDASSISGHILPECSQSVLVFVNGHFSPELSRIEAIPKRCFIGSLVEALPTYGGFLNGQWSKFLKEEMDPFAALNGALHGSGLFLYLAPKTVVEAPIQLMNVIDSGEVAMLVMPRVQIFAGAQSELNLVSTVVRLSGNGYGYNAVADITIEEESHVRLTQAACGFPEDLWHFDAVRAAIKRNATFRTYCVTDGAATVRHDYRVALQGENGEALLNGVWMLGDKRESHTHVLVDHQAPNCRSMQLYKGALNDLSRSSFEGKILVRQAAQKTEAFQLNNNLLLSDRANADSKPNLEIFADDVKASHGSTVGQLDEEQIFYMKTRGFSESMAKNILVHGFCQEVIDMIPIGSVRNAMRERSNSFLL